MTATEERIPVTGPPAGEAGGTAVRLREAGLEDVGRIAGIEGSSFSNPWHEDTFRSLIRRARAFLPVAVDSGDEVVGYAVFWWVMDQGELANLAVAEAWRGRGVGAALLDRVTEHARAQGVESLFLEVRVSNQAARDLYVGRGFRQVAVRKDYYQKPREDAMILMRSL